MSSPERNDEQIEILEEEYAFNTDADTTCTICQAEFLDPDDLTIHLHQIHKITDSIVKFCQFCSSTYTDLINYAEHIRDEHIISLNYCVHCLRAFLNSDAARAHQKGHRIFKKTEYCCTQCKQTFVHVTDLRKHDFNNHNNDNDGIMIQGYFPYLSAVMKIKAETVLQSVDMETIYICVACDYSTSTIEAYLDHAKSSKCRAFVCNECSNVYKKKYYLLRHMKNCNKSSIPLKKIECEECHQEFNRYLYKLHKKTCKVIKCYTCDINFNSMYELSEHQSKEHPLSVELKSCCFCWKQCVGTLALQKHIDRSHKMELHLFKYICIYCKAPFKHPQKLFGHFFSRHKDLEPYTCKICNLKFRVRKRFTLHIKLKHESIGFVEFDENYHVFFTDKKSEKPFIPKSIFANQIETQKKEAAVEKAEDSSNIGFLNINSETEVTETEGNRTEVESAPAPKPTLKRKRAPKAVIEDIQDTISIQSSDDEPLLVVKKRVQKSIPRIIRNRCSKKILTSINKKRFTCNICNKYCYTYQNYNHHISLHSKKDDKKCIKCSKVFRSKVKLNKHIANDHSTSKLTETLKHLIEKRKTGGSLADDLPMSERFRRTIKKVEYEETMSIATITAVENGLSVQKFIENFMPEGESKPDTPIDHAVTCTVVKGTFKEPTIKMTKFETKPTPSVVKLAMPVKFKATNFEKTIASIRMVQQVTLFNEDSPQNDYSYYDDNMDRNDSIPEVAEEVMLEGTEEILKSSTIPHKIVIPKLPVEYKDIRIAHLLPEAPYYKIVKVNEVLKMSNHQNDCKKPEGSLVASKTIKLADGTKLVTANPLAHLLGKTSIEKVLEPTKNKYYKPKVKNFQGMLAEALSKLDKPTPKRIRKKNPEVSESVVSDRASVSVASEKDALSIASDRDSILGV